MGNCYSMDHIAEDHIHTDMTCNIEEPQQKYRLGAVSKSHCTNINLSDHSATFDDSSSLIYRVSYRPSPLPRHPASSSYILRLLHKGNVGKGWGSGNVLVF